MGLQSLLQEDLRKAIMASIQEVDPGNPWIKDASGRHTNVMALLEWPMEDSDDSDSEVSVSALREYGELKVFIDLSCFFSVKDPLSVWTQQCHNHCVDVTTIGVRNATQDFVSFSRQLPMSGFTLQCFGYLYVAGFICRICTSESINSSCKIMSSPLSSMPQIVSKTYFGNFCCKNEGLTHY